MIYQGDCLEIMPTLMDKSSKMAVSELKEICAEMGCSGLSPDMCQNRPYLCKIIRRFLHDLPG